ncbi:tail protein X [Burkholderia glumae]|uniref:tail protein X n=1 Tax=Burkholderia TaxID=32008 RepID=UPI000CFE6555|nr:MULTISPECIES: tail protein X [Burkholderia]MBU9155072.1 tail protein X [Burkholderia gladioli]MCM2495727.1 tail protein X [Burkholderia glumae]MCM2540894.1 tail protein X [Burkholderia glumae]MDC6129196.1 tail protein X [Burkholderia gladioli]PRG48122.1 phage tail protein [Burkholderia gladioli]
MKITARQGETIDAMCWRHYGRTDGTVEAVLEANANLADRGIVLPLGTEVDMPDIETVDVTAPLLQLFD